MTMIKLSKYFSKKELACKHCGLFNFSPRLLTIINLVREDYGKPIYVDSGCRCPTHNKNVGSKYDSAHITTETEQCEAIDIKCAHSYNRMSLLKLFIKHEVNRMGISFEDNFLHVDIDQDKPQGVLFGYKKRKPCIEDL